VITTIVTAGMGLIEALAALATISTDGAKVLDRVTVKQILGALREIYFYDDRTLSLLERTVEGEELSFEEVDRALGGSSVVRRRFPKRYQGSIKLNCLHTTIFRWRPGTSSAA
jgi:hypothetical protein